MIRRAGECLSIFLHAIKISHELMMGFFRLARMPMPMVTFFGGAKADNSGHCVQQAHDLAERFVQHGVSILTGGGPGIMVAASCGAAQGQPHGKKARTLGITVAGVDEHVINPCADTLRVSHFFIRKWLLIRYSIGYVVFPGGVGTIDELFDLLNLLKHHKVPPFPVVLIGTAYWQPIITWFYDLAIREDLLNEDLVKLFVVTDSIDEAYEIIYAVCRQYLEQESNDTH
jgi:uncharacterized protein (TIGR00730 family)